MALPPVGGAGGAAKPSRQPRISTEKQLKELITKRVQRFARFNKIPHGSVNIGYSVTFEDPKDPSSLAVVVKVDSQGLTAPQSKKLMQNIVTGIGLGKPTKAFEGSVPIDIVSRG